MHILKSLNDNAFWQKVRACDEYEYYRKEAIKLWNNHCENKEIGALKYSDFKMFFTSGNRSVYEATYFTRRLALDSSAILSLIYPDEEKYFDRLQDTIYAICDEYTWCLPAHQGQIEKNDNCKVDLFAAETAFALAEIYAILEDRLDPLIKSRIFAEVERRVFSSYQNQRPYSHWETCTNNWNAVCTGSIAGAYMLLAPDRARALIPRFEEAMCIYLSGFLNDGVCTEGCGYWKYGFGFYTVYADMLKTFTDGEIDHFAEDKVKIIATYLQKMYLSGGEGVSFADASGTLAYQLGLQHYLKSVYPDDVLVYPAEHSYIHDHCGRFCLGLRSALWFNKEFYEHPDPVDTETTYYAEESQWFIRKTSSYGFAAKGGHNREHHNHNDVGSFIFAKGGVHILTDPGSGTYSRQYFDNSTRYDFLETSSFGHSLPIIGGAGQKFGVEYAASGTGYIENGFVTDISAAYGIEELTALVRRFDFEEDAVTLTDRFEYCGDGVITERFVTHINPIVESGQLTLSGVTLTPSVSITPTITETTVKGTKPFYLIDFELPGGTREFSLKIK